MYLAPRPLFVVSTNPHAPTFPMASTACNWSLLCSNYSKQLGGLGRMQSHYEMLVYMCVCVSTVEWEVMCIYRALQNETSTQSTDGPTANPSLTTPLTLDQFYSLYRVIDLSWRRVHCSLEPRLTLLRAWVRG